MFPLAVSLLYKKAPPAMPQVPRFLLSPSHHSSPRLARFDPSLLQFGGSPSDIPHTSHLTAGAPTPPHPQRVSALRSLPTQAPGSHPGSIRASNPETPPLHSEAGLPGLPKVSSLEERTHTFTAPTSRPETLLRILGSPQHSRHSVPPVQTLRNTHPSNTHPSRAP